MATNPGEQACQLCHQAHLAPDLYGRKRQEGGFCFHRYCLFFASGLYPVTTSSGRVGFFPSHVQSVLDHAAQKICCVCGKSGACINCWVLGCRRSFHLPCARQGECITQYNYYRAFCSHHRPRQAVDRDPEPHTDCLLCFEAVDDSKSYTTMGCPACQHAWFHRRCIQGHALRAGSSAFCCLLCRDKEHFQQEMLRMGIRIPRRPPAWETAEAFEGLMARHSRCDASHCLCPAGREQAEEEGPWQLLLCSSCAAEGTHRSCSSLRDSADSWECQGCAGPSTASRAGSETPAPSSASRAGPGPRQGSAGPEGSSRSAAPGPVWVRVGSRLQRRAHHQPYSRPRRRR
ncbi:PHD finger protein 7-like [Indicator indicator]|uniref:PHD finger protein 7-like n=1 Tax=Indicator indicator TaxID=1002788 RepID=UPI0023DEC3D1|nr:PHD finger protein 7-like [Indicator indicator]XP_054236849.1 PHD finger protein 7-like [Indicator indicator]XP_054236852.1 PHD finger protein 7-like [Indicator indicator]